MSLSSLFDTVAEDVEHLILVASAEFLKRPWCIGEVTIAHIRKVKTYPLHCTDFTRPDAKFIENYMEHVTSMAPLTENAIALESVQDALRWFNGLPFISLPAKLLRDDLGKLLVNLVNHEMQDLASGVQKRLSIVPPRKEAEIMVAADEDVPEAMASARVLCKLLCGYGAGESRLPEILAYLSDLEGRFELTKSTSIVVVVLTNGCLQSPGMIHMVKQASQVKATLVPVVADDSFRFPPPDFFEKLHSDAYGILEANKQEANAHETANTVVSGVYSMFKRIAPLFDPKTSSGLMNAQSY
jgi:hypothetical protein